MRRLCGGGGLELECEEAMWRRGVLGLECEEAMWGEGG